MALPNHTGLANGLPMSELPGNGKHVAIVGAGIGGVATAALLSKQGFRVSVYEKNSFVGGRCSLIQEGGFRWDQGPSLYLMPETFKKLFEQLEEEMGYELHRCDPNYLLHFHDGTQLQLSSNLASLKQAVEQVEPGSFSKLLQFLAEGHEHMRVSVRDVLSHNFEYFWKLVHPKNIPHLWDLHLHHSMYTRIKKYFKNEKLRKAFTFQAMYMGQSPYDAPSTYSLLQYTEIGDGIWYPQGGFNVVIQRLEHIAEAYGADFNYNAPVSKINIDSTSQLATGITLENGTVIDADLVVCNADLVYAYNHFLPSTRYARRLTQKEFTSSSISFYWGLSKQVLGLQGHNVFLAEKYKASFDSIFKQGTLPDEPSFYIHVPSRMDPAAAPPGKDCVTVLVPAGAALFNSTESEVNALVARARHQVIECIEKSLKINDFEKLIEKEIVNTPHTWERKFHVWRGSILGLAHSVPQVLWFRPQTRHADYPNLFFVGASTHPGTGVPIVVCCSMLVATQILQHVKKGTLYIHETVIRQVYIFLMALFLGYLNLLLWPLRKASAVFTGYVDQERKLRDPYHALNNFSATSVETEGLTQSTLKLRAKMMALGQRTGLHEKLKAL